MVVPSPSPMCKKRTDTLATDPTPRLPSRSSATASSAAATSSTTDSGSNRNTSSASSATSRSSLATLRSSLPARPAVYPFPEIRSATNNFLAPRLSPSSWRCTLRGVDAVLLQLPFHGGEDAAAAVPARLADLSRSHHTSLVRLLGASLTDSHIYLVYQHTPGAPLSQLLHSTKNPSFTPLSRWIQRIQIADDLAQGLDYIHTHAAAVHGRIDSSNVLITDPDLRAKICLFGAADLAGEGLDAAADVLAFGVVMLELVSGEEAERQWYDGGYERKTVVEAARGAVETGVRRWVDWRLGDSFPVEVAERAVRVALRCVEAEPGRRPGMGWVAGKVSRLLIESQAWERQVAAPVGISVSLAPR